MLFPEVSPNGRVGVVDEDILVVHDLRLRREDPFEVPRLGEFRDRVTPLAAKHHGDLFLPKRRDQPLEPAVVGRDGVGGEDGDERPARGLDPEIERMAEREVLRPEPHDPGAERLGDFPGSVE